MPWIVDVLAGLSLAVLLYLLVRFRMIAAPKMRDRFGSWARWLTWVVVAMLMVLVANLELLGLRELLRTLIHDDSFLAHEILFALVGLGAGYFLVSRYATRNHRDKVSDGKSDRGKCL